MAFTILATGDWNFEVRNKFYAKLTCNYLILLKYVSEAQKLALFKARFRSICLRTKAKMIKSSKIQIQHILVT